MATSRKTSLRSSAPASAPTDDSQAERLILHEERLETRTVPDVVGHVRVSKDVVEEDKTFDVEVMNTEVATTRRPVDRAATADTAPYQEGDTLVIPVIEERVQMRKVPWIVEEIVVRRTAKRETRSISATVRREVARIETVGDVEEANRPPST